MTTAFAQQLEINGPDRCETLTADEARLRTRSLASKRYENFSVLSRLVPENRRDDFGALYAFCRWSDDLSDEVGDPERSLELLSWWREELHRCYDGTPRHPVFVALRPTVEQHDLPMDLFDRLIRAFEQDQRKPRYDTWAEVLDYCTGSADPVGRLVLMILGEPREESTFQLSDRVCTALQLTNHWQDVKRDILERDRVYIPRELNEIENFEARLKASALQGYAVDHTFLEQSRRVIRKCVDRTWPLFEEGEQLLDRVSATSRPIIWLFIAGGETVLHRIEQWNCETVLHRPKLSPVAKALLVARAHWKFRRAGRVRQSEPSQA